MHMQMLDALTALLFKENKVVKGQAFALLLSADADLQTLEIFCLHKQSTSTNI